MKDNKDPSPQDTGTDQDLEEAPSGTPEEGPRTGSTVFLGRAVQVRLPSIEQTAVMHRIQRRYALAQVNADNLTIQETIALIDSALTVIQMLMAEQQDRDWVENLLATGEASLLDLLPFMESAMVAVRAANADRLNRADRRAAGKGAVLDTSGS
jgi:hypothetical protein